MEHMVGRTVVQTRLSLEELHKAVQREVGTWRVGKGGGGHHGTAVLNSGIMFCSYVPIS